MRLKKFILKSLLASAPSAMPQEALFGAVLILIRPSNATLGDFEVALNQLQNEKLVMGATDDFTQEVSWTLTTNGVHQARKL